MKRTVPNRASGERKKIALIILVTIALVAIIAALIFNLTGRNRTTMEDPQTASQSDAGNTPADSAQSGADGASQADTQTQIEALISQYRTAFANADIEALKTIYNTDEVMNSDVITATAQIITGYENTACYIKDGMDDTSRVVFIYDDFKIDGIDTLIPNISYVYVRQKDDGSYYIYPGEYDQATSDYVYSSDIQKYISELIKDDDISSLYTAVNDRMAAVMEEDPEVKTFVEQLTVDETDSQGETAQTGTETSSDGSISQTETDSLRDSDTAGETSDSGTDASGES